MHENKHCYIMYFFTRDIFFCSSEIFSPFLISKFVVLLILALPSPLIFYNTVNATSVISSCLQNSIFQSKQNILIQLTSYNLPANKVYFLDTAAMNVQNWYI